MLVDLSQQSGEATPDIDLLAGFLPGDVDQVRRFQAAALLDAFGSLRAVLHASASDLQTVDGCTKRIAEHLTQARVFLESCLISNLPEIRDISWEYQIKRLYFEMAHLAEEQVRALYFSHTDQVIKEDVLAIGTHQSATMSMRALIRPALTHRSAKILLIHNHPSGFPQPSAGDMAVTQRVQQLCKLLDLQLLDHLIVAELGVMSILRGNMLFSASND